MKFEVINGPLKYLYNDIVLPKSMQHIKKHRGGDPRS